MADSVINRLKEAAGKIWQRIQSVPYSSLIRTKAFLIPVAIVGVIFLGTAFFAISYYARMSNHVTERLTQGVFSHSVAIYSSSKNIFKGQPVTQEYLISSLRRAGYSNNGEGTAGTYQIQSNILGIEPGPNSFLHRKAVEVEFDQKKINSITEKISRKKLTQYELDPQLLSNLSGDVRQRRRLIQHGELPQNLIQALLSAEDRKFFDHWGFDIPRVVKAVLVNLKSGRREQGGSTITMQLARNIWLSPDKTWKRKANEALITCVLEQKLSKEEILEHYANEIYLGNHGSFEIHGFGEAAWRYFNRDVGSLTLPQAALLAGLVQRPNYFDPFRHPERAKQRRDTVLGLMNRNEFITDAQLKEAVESPLLLRERTLDSGDAPYFVDLALDQARKLSIAQNGSIQLFTTVDPDLQSAAAEAVAIGMKKVDALVEKKKAKPPYPQVALVAIDAKTGEVKAAIGGRNYGESQLNRVLAKRQPGSIFKPFVYAAALETQLGGKHKEVFTGATLMMDEPTTFQFGSETYQPGNFGNQFNGPVLLRRALTKSLNIPTVAIAESVGYKQVVDVAKRSGMQSEIRATPAVALGAYEVTPLEMAGAYTVFANEGSALETSFISSVVSSDGKEIYRYQPKPKKALDPRINFLMLDLLQDVLRSGTGAGVWSYGLRAQAAGKTGTSRDGWFAGFTSELICIVWVGYDDHRDLNLEGAKSALPIWGEFMKRATAGGAYSRPFGAPPKGITQAKIDAETGELASSFSEKTRTEYFLPGYEPSAEASFESIESARRSDEELSELKLAAVEMKSQNGNIGTAVWYRAKESDPSDELIGVSAVLPLGTRVRVTNLASGKSVVVQIKSRMAESPGVVISLNQRAASELDFMRAGSAQVKIEPLNKIQ